MDTTDKSSEPIDAVFVIGTGSKNGNEELKYALRNMARNCPFIRDVYISGECPSWIDKSIVKHLQWPDRFSHAKDSNIIDKLRHACEHPGIAKKILFCSDDQFQTRVCTWDDFSPRWLRRFSSDDKWYADRKRVWHTRLQKTLEKDKKRRIEQKLNPDNVYYYQPHMWMQIDRDKFIEYAKWCNYEHSDDTIIASGYFNYIDAGGKQNFDHVFISAGQNWPVSATHIAYSDTSYLSAMRYLKDVFKTPCEYEVGGSIRKTDGKIIAKFKSILSEKKEWENLSKELETIDSMYQHDIPGWKLVLNDMIMRWSEITRSGNDIVTVDLSDRDHRLDQLIEAYKSNSSVSRMAEIAKDLKDHKPEPIQKDGKKCTPCEKRRKKLLEEQKRRDKEISEKSKDTILSITTDTVPEEEKDNNTLKNDACITCASEHLATAAAYLNSNFAQPTALETELALGELRVASKHLLALGQNKLYNMCMEIIKSYTSEKSLLSVDNVKSVLKKVIEVNK